MRAVNGKIIYSSQDLKDFVECKFAIDLDIADLSLKVPRAADSALDIMLQNKGNDFEEHYHADVKDRYERDGLTVREIPYDGSIEDRALETVDAMSAGADLIYQACLFCQPWQGYPDYIRKVDGKSRFGNYK